MIKNIITNMSEILTTIAKIAGGAIAMFGILQFVKMVHEKKEKIKVSESDWRGVKLCIEELKEKTDKHDVLLAELRTEFKTRMEYIQGSFNDIKLSIKELLSVIKGDKK